LALYFEKIEVDINNYLHLYDYSFGLNLKNTDNIYTFTFSINYYTCNYIKYMKNLKFFKKCLKFLVLINMGYEMKYIPNAVYDEVKQCYNLYNKNSYVDIINEYPEHYLKIKKEIEGYTSSKMFKNKLKKIEHIFGN